MKKKRSPKISNKVWIIVFFFLVSASASVFVFKNSEEPPRIHKNLLDTKISLNSERLITNNAMATNPEFKNIAFAEKSSTQFSFADQMAAAIKSIKSIIEKTPQNEAREYGSWIWTPIMDMTPKYIESTLSDAKKNGINVMYVSVDSYLDIFVMPKGKERDAKKAAFSKKLEDFIIRANKKGIAVDAEAGWQNWAEPGNEYKAYAVVNFVKNFNETRQNKFRGFQYDVEPYLLNSYKEKPSEVLRNFVELIDQTQIFIKDSGLKLSVVVPDFFDEKDGFTPKFSYNGKKEYVFKHILNILDRQNEGSIIIMSYRNFAEGEDGAVEVSKNEMQTAQKGKYKTKIIIAQETGDVPPPYITFHSTSKKYLNGQIAKIDEVFNNQSNFGGVAIHYINAFLALK